MLRYVLLRLSSLVVTLFIASILLFLFIEVLPGDPAQLMLGMNADPQSILALRHNLGLDQPLFWRYIHWITQMLQGDFGISYTYDVSVGELIRERLAVSIPLALFALFLSIGIGLPLGVIAARNRGRWLDRVLMSTLQIGMAIPNFWLGLVLIFVCAVSLGLLPSGGFTAWNEDFFAAFRALILPSLALALPQSAIIARVMRSSLIDKLGEDYVRTARAKGLSKNRCLWHHGVRNALIPVLTILGLQFSFLIAGTVIIESVFYLPGLGRLVFQAISQRDLIVVKGVVMLLVTMTITISFIIDIAYALVDPRLRSA
ncbi:ABC transporter permease [Polycladidibacter stylochi]|uniref:ABC transporter permease n=1 Tax=Polycladidibacter stylochi TaxID=1807766 RepID=UPI00082D4B01|nr:ABC transporter permease [Pseudovibrio stylochi]